MLIGDTDSAFWKLRELVKGDTNNVSAYIKLGDILREKDKGEQAVKIHQSLIFRRNLRTEVKIEIYRSLANDYFQMNQFPRAEENAKRILRLDRKNEWAAKFLVKICERRKRWQDASLYLKKLERITGEPDLRNHARYIMMQGRENEDRGEIEQAKNCYLKAVKTDEQFADPHLYLGNIFQRKKDLEKADGGNTDAVSGLVNVMAARGEYDQALTLVDEVLLRNNRSIRARLAKMKLALREIQKDQLAAEIDEIVDLIHDGKSTPVRSS
jgi:lipopolysaccharide biosynthesis regulator YciM